jgi:hypothetical protein
LAVVELIGNRQMTMNNSIFWNVWLISPSRSLIESRSNYIWGAPEVVAIWQRTTDFVTQL